MLAPPERGVDHFSERFARPLSCARVRRAARRRPARNLGLNENLAREILELHTLGVGGGYDQADVQALARVISGWSVGGGDEAGRFTVGKPGEFAFRDAIHEPGA